MPDANGQIILVSLPFYESPFARLVKPSAASDDITSATAIRPESVERFKDWMKDNKIYAWRMNCQSMTVSYTGNALNQGGTVVAATMQPAIDNKTVLSEAGILESYARTVDRVPVTPQAVQSQARSYYNGKASEGVYLVNRHVNATLPFTTRNSDQAKAYAGIWKGQSVTYKENFGYFATDANAGVLINDKSGAGVPLTGPSCTDIGVVMFSGGNTEQSYLAKFVVSCEFIIKPGSPYASQCDPIPPRNYQFLQALSRAASKANYGNADSNSWGSLFNGLKKAWDFVMPVADVVSDMLPPQYAAPLKTITSVSKQLKKAADKLGTQPSSGVNQPLLDTMAYNQPSVSATPLVAPAQPRISALRRRS